MLKTLQLSDGKKVVAIEKGTGEPVVFIHGVGLQAQAWESQINYLSPRFRVLALNMPGHAGSDGLFAGAGLAAFVDWAAQVIQAIDTKPVNIVGHSMGAMIAIGLAVRYPQLIKRAVLMNAVYRRDDVARQAVIHRADEIQKGGGDVLAPLTRWFGEGWEKCQASRRVKQWLLSIDQAEYAIAYRAFATGDSVYADKIANIDCPTMVMTGDGDSHSTPEMADAMAKAIPLGELFIIKGHRHMMTMTASKEVNQYLLNWLLKDIGILWKNKI